jgi:hypothetical protein
MTEQGMHWTFFVGMAIVFGGTMLYLLIHMVGLVRVLTCKDSEPPSGASLAAWIVSFIGGFTGPLIILASFLSVGIGLFALRGGPSARSKICIQNGMAASLTIILMTVGMLAFMLPTMLA